MKKKHVFMAIAFFVIGLVYGSIFNFILRGENASLLLSYVQGLFVGTLSVIIYCMIFLFLGHCVDPEYFDNSTIKATTITCNIVAITGLIYGSTMSISNFVPISRHYAWMHIVVLAFSIIVVVKANYDGNVFRKNKK